MDCIYISLTVMSNSASMSDSRARLQQKKERAKQYYQTHRQDILARCKQASAVRYHCICGANVASCRRDAHECTEKHQRYLMKEKLNDLMQRMQEDSLSASAQLCRATNATMIEMKRMMVT
jgi:hypothetical protein